MDTYYRSIYRSKLSRRRVVLGASGVAAGAAFLAACGGGSSDNAGKPAGGARKSDLLATKADTSSKAVRGGKMASYMYTPEGIGKARMSNPVG